MSYHKVVAIAHRVRREFEEEFPDDRTLFGQCWLASCRIRKYALRAGIRGVLMVAGDCHYFIRYRDWLIDVTATQFARRNKRVVIKRAADMKRIPSYWVPEAA